MIQFVMVKTRCEVMKADEVAKISAESPALRKMNIAAKPTATRGLDE